MSKRVIAATILAVLIVPFLIFGFRVLFSDIKGQGEAIVNKNSATNRVGAQERFESLYAEVLSADQRIDVDVAAAAANPTTVNQTNLTGTQNYCLSVVADYNAEARKYSSSEWRSEDLPPQIDPFDPATDCKPQETAR